MSGRWYGIATREIEMYPGSYEPPEPTEYGRLFVWARAQTARRAKVIAVRWFRRNERLWALRCLEDGNPFKGMTTFRYDPAEETALEGREP